MKSTKSKAPQPRLPVGRFDVMGAGHDAFRDLAAILGTWTPEVVGWCQLEVSGEMKPAIVLSQKWPFIPFGTDPAPILKARRYAAVVPMIDCFQVIEIAAPPQAEAFDALWKPAAP